jgi:hypothetical protein
MQVVKTQMDQEAEIMKQSMARQEAAQQAAPQEEDEQAGPLKTASSGARGMCLKHLWKPCLQACACILAYAGSQRLLQVVLCPVRLGEAYVCITHVAMLIRMVCECWTGRGITAGLAAIAVYNRKF